MQTYVNATLKIFVLGLIAFVALSGCENQLSEILGESNPLVKPGKNGKDTLVLPGDSIPIDTNIVWPDTIPFPFPHDSIPQDTIIRPDTLPGNTIYYPPVDTLNIPQWPNTTVRDTTGR